MTPADRDALMRLLQRVAVGLDVPLPTLARVDFYIDSLPDLSIEQVELALRQHARTSPHFPKPADILGALAAVGDGRPGAEEAWAIAIGFADESATITWTDEMASAWNTARGLYAIGDKVGARMAFKEAYLRHVEDARRWGTPVRWCASLGFDAAGRRDPLVEAKAAGRLTDLSTTVQIAGSSRSTPALPLLELAKQPGVPEHAREALGRLQERFAAKADAPSHDQLAKEATDAAKAESAERVQAYIEIQAIGERVADRLGGLAA